MNLSHVAFESGNVRLAAALHRADSPGAPAIVMCCPFFEERKSACRAFAETADALCRAGISVLRFDYRGCGDSAGEFPAFGLPDWEQDARAALALVRELTAPRYVGILGLRAGSIPAFQAAASDPDVKRVVLWEPVVNGREHVRRELRKKLTREMVTFGRSRATRAGLLDTLEAGQSIDFDGYTFSARLYRQLSRTDLTALSLPPRVRSLVVSLTASGRPSPDAARLAGQMAAGDQSARLLGLALPPFWNLVGYVDTAPLIRATIDWLGDE